MITIHILFSLGRKRICNLVSFGFRFFGLHQYPFAGS